MTQDVNFYDKPLSDEEFVEIGELLALMPEPYESMEPDRMDGFLTAIALLVNGCRLSLTKKVAPTPR